MFVEVGFSDNPDTAIAGREAIRQALQRAQRTDCCDMVLLFATARHDAHSLRKAVSTAVGPTVPIVGGAAIGVITNTQFGYAGDQVALALIWFAQGQCELFVQGGLNGSEVEVGRLLGQRLINKGIGPDTSIMLFYDAIDRSRGDVRIAMAVYLLQGLEEGMGFLPNIMGGGLQGDYTASATHQWTGTGIGQHTTLALAFGEGVRIDHTIMHGCRPATSYYTVTKADQQTILEINNVPALDFMEQLLGNSVPPENFPFFLAFGVNDGNKWGDFDETNYASRLCLAIDRERKALVMFEPDMVAGTEFQLMYRSLDFDYMMPRIDSLFANLEGRKAVFALYIDCAGRAAGYGGAEIEDALVVQRAVGNKVPLLGLYSGVEIASIKGRPRGLDWTGVFCLFSVPA